MTANQFEPDYEEIVEFTLHLSPAETGMMLAALRSYQRINDKRREQGVKKWGDDYDPTVADEKDEVMNNIKRKIRKAGYG